MASTSTVPQKQVPVCLMDLEFSGFRLRGSLGAAAPPELAARMQQWLGLSPFAAEPKRVAA